MLDRLVPSMQGALGSSGWLAKRRWGTGNTATECACPAYSWSVRKKPSLSLRSERKPGFWLSGGEALLLVLLLSFGLWAVIWGAVALLAMGGWS
jgi:hypothetical protein